MINLKMKYILFKQRKCIEAINFVTQSDNQYIYITAQKFIDYHKSFMDLSKEVAISDPLIALKIYYYKDLKKKEQLLDTLNENESSEIIETIEVDKMIIDELTDDFIFTYNEILQNIKYISRNIKYLDDNQKLKLLTFYYEFINLTKVRTVK